jgi:hypothetical protein
MTFSFKKAADFSDAAFEKKDRPSPMKSVTFCRAWFFSKKREQTSPQILHANVVLLIYSMIPRNWAVVDG